MTSVEKYLTLAKEINEEQQKKTKTNKKNITEKDYSSLSYQVLSTSIFSAFFVISIFYSFLLLSEFNLTFAVIFFLLLFTYIISSLVYVKNKTLFKAKAIIVITVNILLVFIPSPFILSLMFFISIIGIFDFILTQGGIKKLLNLLKSFGYYTDSLELLNEHFDKKEIDEIKEKFKKCRDTKELKTAFNDFLSDQETKLKNEKKHADKKQNKLKELESFILNNKQAMLEVTQALTIDYENELINNLLNKISAKIKKEEQINEINRFAQNKKTLTV